MIKVVPKILIVIKDTALRQLYHELFIKEGWEVVIAYDITSGLVELINHKISLVVLDGELAGKSTTKLLGVVSGQKKWAKIPIILINYEGGDCELDKLREQRCEVVEIESQSSTPDEIVTVAKNLIEN